MDEIPLTVEPLKVGAQPAAGVKAFSPELRAFLKDV